MATKFSFGYSVTESAKQKARPPISQGVTVGGMINSNSGYANIPITIQSREELSEQFGDTNSYNYLNYRNCYDFLATDVLPLTLVRPIHDTAYNAGIKYDGLKTRTRIKPTVQMFNEDVAKFNLQYNISTGGEKLSIFNRYVTTYQDTAVAICSHKENYDQPIMNIKVDSIRKDSDTPPSNPVQYEKHMIKRITTDIAVINIVGVSGNMSENSFEVPGDHSYVTDTTKLIVSGSPGDDGIYIVDSVSYDSSADITTFVITTAGTDGRIGGTISWLRGSWGPTEFETGDIVEYKGSTWTKKTISTGDTYYFQATGQTKVKTSSDWIVTDTHTPVYRIGTSVVSYAIKEVVSSSLISATGDVVSFKDLFGEVINFENGEVIIIELKKDHTTGKWSYANRFFGNYNQYHRNDSGVIDYIVDVVNEGSTNIYMKSGYSVSKISTTSVLPSIIIGGDQRNIIKGDKLKIYNISKSGALENINVTVTGVSYTAGTDPTYSTDTIVLNGEFPDFGVYDNPTSGITTITVQEPLAGYSIDGKTLISTEMSGFVSTNQTVFADKYSNEYDESEERYSTGYSIDDIMIYDYSPTNEDGDSVTDYSDVTEDTMNASAELFLGETVNTSILMSFQTRDEFGQYHVDKMASIARQRTATIAVVAPMDDRLFLGKTKAEKLSSVVEQFGNKRANVFSGQFTQFSEFVTILPTMKEVDDIVTRKPITTSIIGDYARMLATLDRTDDGLYMPVANTNRGTFNNQNKLSFIPDENGRELLGMNGINSVYYDEDNMPNPIKMGNLTGYIPDVDIMKKEHVRLTLNKIENYVKINVFPLYYQFIDDQLTGNLLSIINTRLEKIRDIGTIERPIITFDTSENDTLKINMELIFTDVLERVVLNVNMYPSSFTIDEIVNA